MTNSRTLRPATLVTGLALALALSLTACAAPATPTAGEPGTTPPAPTSPAGGTATGTLPDGFPTADVPLISGPILHASHTGNIWGVWIGSTNLAGDLAKATVALEAAGYENVILSDDYADFHGSKYQVHVVAKDDPKYGPSVLYAFYAVQ